MIALKRKFKEEIALCEIEEQGHYRRTLQRL